MTVETENPVEAGPLALAQQEREKWQSGELAKANKIIGNLLSQTDMRSERRPILYDIWIKIRGLLYATTCLAQKMNL